MARGAFIVPNGGFGIANVRQRIQTALDKYVRYSRLRLRQRPRTGKVTICASTDVAVLELHGGEWTMINSSTSIFGLQINQRGNVRTILNVLPALVTVGLVAKDDFEKFKAWIVEEERERARFDEYKQLRNHAERLGYKIIRAVGDEARKRRAGGR